MVQVGWHGARDIGAEHQDRWHSGCILKADLMRFAHGLDVGNGKGVKDKLKIFGLRTGSMWLLFVTWGRLWLEQSWQGGGRLLLDVLNSRY